MPLHVSKRGNTSGFWISLSFVAFCLLCLTGAVIAEHVMKLSLLEGKLKSHCYSSNHWHGGAGRREFSFCSFRGTKSIHMFYRPRNCWRGTREPVAEADAVCNALSDNNQIIAPQFQQRNPSGMKVSICPLSLMKLNNAYGTARLKNKYTLKFLTV